MADEFDQRVVPRAKAKALAAVKFANEAHEKFLATWDLDPPIFRLAEGNLRKPKIFGIPLCLRIIQICVICVGCRLSPQLALLQR